MVRNDHIGGIRGVATAFGVGASAVGPLIVAVGFRATGDYVTLNFSWRWCPQQQLLQPCSYRLPQGNVFSFAYSAKLAEGF